METIDWSNLSFGYMPTDYNVRYTYKNNAWGDLEIWDTPDINLHIGCNMPSLWPRRI